ncbi:hypothetical protein QJS04_geneDACA006588 [Acorus gramineus]|uniref:Small nuclear RNA activating complex polypeptide 1 n=1 Tax=Acorus gramineus TaxID=55184 RepID=A0AAV9AZN0_ACOGR|nr:hypothetical protein QJS04_geneDACA006588 [Acorus gramineus]
MAIDLTPFKLDLDELLEEFSRHGWTSLSHMKSLWRSRKFSFIYEAKPSSNLALFMQSLFAHSIGYMVKSDSLSWRLGGLYCLYCLYLTQPFKPPFKIYLSLGELKRLKCLVVDAKQNGVEVVPVLIKQMLEKNMFLFGCVEIADDVVSERVNEMTRLQNLQLQVAYQRLFGNSRIDDYVHMDLGMELDLKGIKEMSTEYARSKKLAIEEAGELIDIQDIKHIAENEKLIGDKVEKIVDDWNAQKEIFYKETGVLHSNEMVAVDDFDEELENLLTDA